MAVKAYVYLSRLSLIGAIGKNILFLSSEWQCFRDALIWWLGRFDLLVRVLSSFCANVSISQPYVENFPKEVYFVGDKNTLINQ